MWLRDCTTVSVPRQLRLLLVVVTGLLMTACSPKPLPLNDFIDNLRAELIKTDAITRLTTAQVAAGQGDDLLRSEQDAQCSSDPILVMLGGDLAFNLKASVGKELKPAVGVDVSALSTKVSASGVGIVSSGEHQLNWKVSPISLGNLANVVFDCDIKTIQTIRAIEGPDKMETEETKKIKKALLEQAWDIRTKIETTANRLIKDWKKPATCQKL
jgi:hypothetical protein